MQAVVRRAGAVRALAPLRGVRYETTHGGAYVESNKPSAPAVAYHQQEPDPQLDGYPQLPYISRQRLPAKGWWDNQMRRNYGDHVRQPCNILNTRFANLILCAAA
jgi:NADH dehydrogenase (ubiquinone) 1 beta subcomplex subunit 8